MRLIQLLSGSTACAIAIWSIVRIADTAVDAGPIMADAVCSTQDDGHEPEGVLQQADASRRDALNQAMLAMERKGRLQRLKGLPWLRRDALPDLAHPLLERKPRAELYSNIADATVMFHNGSKCNKCENWHGGVATGFIIHPDGWIVTAAHVVRDPDANEVGAVMMHDGSAAAVVGVYSVDDDRDVAIVKVDATNLPALPLRLSNALPGEDVVVVSHPQSHFFLMTAGIVSRVLGVQDGTHQRMQITAEFATGSSGAPVCDDRGNVVGLVSSTRTLYAKPKEHESPQMVIRNCVSVEDLLDLLDQD